MKKIIFAIICFIFSITGVMASEIPNSIFYLNDGLYSYLYENESINNLLDSDHEIYVEYRLYIDSDELKTLEKKEVNKDVNNYLLITKDDDIFEKLDEKNLQIDCRYVVDGNSYDWSEKENIISLDLIDIPKPKISNLKIDSKITYKIDNEDEINSFLKTYLMVFNKELNYIEEYRINDENWISESFNSKIDLEDIKIDFRIKYKIDSEESEYSNILTYEKHPERICMFGSDICCNTILDVSICIWIFSIFIIFVIVLIYIDHKKRLIKEA